ncbi:MAG: hypothetical protein ACLT98_10370 [Eggerthellaceae bacterium]
MNEEGLGEAAELISPMNAEQSCMRRTIVHGLLRNVAYNQSRGVAISNSTKSAPCSRL